MTINIFFPGPSLKTPMETPEGPLGSSIGPPKVPIRPIRPIKPPKGLVGPLKGPDGPLKGPDGVLLGPQWGQIWAQLFINDFFYSVFFYKSQTAPSFAFPGLLPLRGPFWDPLGPPGAPFRAPFGHPRAPESITTVTPL
jgi:hypothetical protein